MAEYIVREFDHGTVNISEEVICHIVKDSIKDIDGIGGISNTAGAEIAEMVGFKHPVKGLKVSVENNSICVEVIITVKYGFNIVKVSTEAQNSIVSELQSSTGIDNVIVNINVSGISFT